MEFVKLSMLTILALGQVNAQSHSRCLEVTQVPEKLTASDDFSFANTGLQIFPDLQIPCTGNIVKWIFMTRTSFVNKLHLAIYRKSGDKEYRNVGETFIDNYQAAPVDYGKPNWVELSLPQGIRVEAGDVLGMYYDTYKIEAKDVPIPSKELDVYERPDVKQAYVILEGASVGRGVVDVSEAINAYRVPAIRATILPENKSPTDYTSPSPTWYPGATPPTYYPPQDPPSWYPPPPSPSPGWYQPPPPPPTWYPGATAPPSVVVYPSQGPPGQWQPPGLTDNARCRAQASTYLVCDSYQRRKRSYFDFKESVCVEYEGCPPPDMYGNSFDSLQECVATCHTWDPFEVCRKRPSSYALCEGSTTRYFYDSIRDSCGIFTGCPTNPGDDVNNFETLQECEQCKKYAKRYAYLFGNSLQNNRPVVVYAQSPPPAQPVFIQAPQVYHHHDPLVVRPRPYQEVVYQGKK